MVQRQGCTLFSSLTQACSLFVKGAEVHPNLFSDADSCWLKSRSEPCDLSSRAFSLLLSSSSARCRTASLRMGCWEAHGTGAGWALPGTVIRNLSYARVRELMHCLFKNNIFLQECRVISVVIQQCLLGEENNFLRSQQRSCSLQWTAVSVQGMAWRQEHHRGDLRWGGYLFLAAPFPAVSS